VQVNKLSAALEDLSDEAVLLRRKAGLPSDERLDTAGVKLQRDITIAQLRSVNALLERQVRCWTQLACNTTVLPQICAPAACWGLDSSS
jgi:hypothetical protein